MSANYGITSLIGTMSKMESPFLSGKLIIAMPTMSDPGLKDDLIKRIECCHTSYAESSVENRIPFFFQNYQTAQTKKKQG